ncbi:MAG: ATP synthase F1 subunit delta [Mycoplasma sp.]
MLFQSNVNEFARAIYEIATEKNSAELFHGQILLIQETFLQYHDFYQIYINSGCDRNIKKNIIKDVFKDSLDIDLLNFLLYLTDQKLSHTITSIISKTLKLLENELNVLNVKIFTPFELEDSTIKLILDRVYKKTNKKPIPITIIDPNLIGGIRLQFDSKLFDNTIATKLKTIQQNIRRGK